MEERRKNFLLWRKISILYQQKAQSISIPNRLCKAFKSKSWSGLYLLPMHTYPRGASILEPPHTWLAQHLGFYRHCRERVWLDPLLVIPNFSYDWMIWYALTCTVFFVVDFSDICSFDTFVLQRRTYAPQNYFYTYRFQSLHIFLFLI